MNNQLFCQLCEDEYTEENPPRLLIACGHTFCEDCLKKMITEKSGTYKLLCPDDGSLVCLKQNSISSLPINLALQKILNFKKNVEESNRSFSISNILKNQEAQQDDDTRDLVATLTSQQNTKDNLVGSQERSQEEAKKYSQKKETQKQNEGRLSLTQKEEQQQLQKILQYKQQKPKAAQKQLCLIHNKPLQVVCVNELKKICSSCAIFGDHRGHDFKSIEQIEKQREIYYNSILKIMETKQTISEKIQSQQTFSQILQILYKKKQNIKKEILSKFQRLISTIQAKQKESMKSLDQVILKTQSKLRGLAKIDHSILSKYDKWEEKSFKEIKILEGPDFDAKLELLFVGQNNEQDVIEQGNMIIGLIKNQEQNLMNEVETALDNIGLQSNTDIFNHVDSYVQLFDETKKKKNKARITKIDPQIQNNFPISTALNSSIMNSKFTNFQKKVQISQQQKLRWKMPKSIQIQIDRQAQIQIQKVEKVQTSISQQHEQSLLQTLQDVQLKVNQITIMEKKQEVIPQPIMVKDTPEKTQIPDLGLNSNQSIERNKSDQVESKNSQNHSGKKSPQLTERSKKDLSFVLDKADRDKLIKKKLQKIKVGQKYEKMLQGLAFDKLETIDFTNAQLGDSIVIQLCQFISGSKAKTVKFIRNKLNDDAVQKILPHMNGVITLNLSQNFLTQKVLDIICNCKQHIPSMKNIILSQNKIIERKSKAKIDKIRSLDIVLSV